MVPLYKGMIFLNRVLYDLLAVNIDLLAVLFFHFIHIYRGAVLQNNVLEPLLGIHDPKIDKRIDFVGGIRGLGELERRCDEDCVLAFSMYATSIGELFAVADAGLLMPPKSTWFEPKLRSGLFIHRF